MKKFTERVLRYTIDKAKRSSLIQNVFESPLEVDKFEKMAEFVDSKGNTLILRQGLRGKIKPGWENILKDRKIDTSPENLERFKTNGKISVEKFDPILKSFGKNIEDSRILEIGCHSGAASFALAESGAFEVTATDFSGYKVEAIEKQGTETSKLEEVNGDLLETREKLRTMFPNSDRVNFMDDDICNSGLPLNHFDIVCNWEVLEHLYDAEKSIATMASVVKQDGIIIIEYNPFFCLTGGHSLCTLDLLWGHVLLNEDDFIRYMDKFRPNEKEKALSFFRKGLNRMTLHDLKNYFTNAGLVIESLILFSKEQHVRMVTQEILEMSKINYPTLSFTDLVTPRVIIVARRV